MDSELPPAGDDEAVEAPPRPRPVHLRLRYLGLVWVGGTAGTAARYLVSVAVPPAFRVPVAILAVNLVGAFLLGLLLEVLVRRGDDSGRRRVLRLLLGTGFLGGFTTYSALAVDTVTLLRAGLSLHAVVYAAVTLAGGALATWAGIVTAGRLQRRPTTTSGAA